MTYRKLYIAFESSKTIILLICISKSLANHDQDRKPIPILYWTTFYSHPDFMFGFGQKPFLDANCKISNCYTTMDKDVQSKAGAVLFHMRNVNQNTPLPVKRKQSQRYVFFLMEHPYHQWNDLTKWEGFFNLTMTYRLDSDVPCPYGRTEKISSKPNASKTETIHNGNHCSKNGESNCIEINKNNDEKHLKSIVREGNEDKPHERNLNNYKSDKRIFEESAIVKNNERDGNFNKKMKRNERKLVAWFVSNCRTSSGRENYVKELQKYIPVDIFGDCGPLDCDKKNTDGCYSMLEENYKFYLSFENIHCEDYVTEKLFNVLNLDVVPIIMGGTDYLRDAPPHSVINVDDFKSPGELAKYIRHLDSNHEEYDRYKDWRTTHKVYTEHKTLPESFCKLCEILNDKNYPNKIYNNLHRWWGKYTKCDKGVIDRMTKTWN